MKILFFTPSLGNGGAESHMARLANGLGDLGHEVIICSARGGGSYESWVSKRVRVINLTSKVKSSTLSLFCSWLPLARCLRVQQPDVVMSNLNNASAVLLLAWQRAGKPGKLVIGVQNNFTAEMQNSSWWYRYTLEPFTRKAFEKACHIIALSEGVRQNLLNVHLKGKKAEADITTIYNICMDQTTLSLQQENLLLERPAGNLLVAAGRLGPQKDYPTMFAAAKLLREKLDFTLWVLGRGPQEEELKQWVKNNGLEDTVVFLGFQNNPFPFFAAADAFVLSSRWEGFGNVLVEAMSSGAPLISTDCDYGPSEIMEGGKYGMLSPVGDAAALARNMEKLLTDDDLRLRLSEEGCERARLFSQERITGLYEVCLLKIAG